MGLSDRRFRPVDSQHLGALVGEELGRGRANARSRTCHDRDLASQPTHGILPYSVLRTTSGTFRTSRNFRYPFWAVRLECTPKVRQQNCGEFPPVSASFRRAERRKPAAAAHAERVEIVDESDAPDCCQGFPPFPPFPPLVFAVSPKGDAPAH